VADRFVRLQAALIGRYTLERELGREGWRWCTSRKTSSTIVASRSRCCSRGSQRLSGGERFLREIRAAARLNHPHILPLHDSGEADGFLYYVMPYVEGESVRDRLNRDNSSRWRTP
jgi:serine/threonine-protein kinase